MTTRGERLRAHFDVWAAALVFGCTALLLWWLVGHRLVLINDEGIYLDGARRILEGSWAYRDFFVLTGPGAFWNVALMFQIFGTTLASARLLLVADLAVIAACMYWLTAKLHSRPTAVWLTSFYVALLAGDAGGLVVNHRWDSAALSLAGAAFLLHGIRSGAGWALATAGAAAGYAAWVTPTLLLVLLPMLAWVLHERGRRGTQWFLAGIAAISAAACGVLAVTDSLLPMIHHFQWTASQYAGANRFPYGGIIGGYRALFADAAGLEVFLRAYVLLFVVMPAIVPFAAGLSLAAARKLWRREIWYLALCASAAVLTCAPRMDVAHLTYGAPLSFVLAAVGLAVLLPERAGAWLAVFLSVGACLLAANAFRQRLSLETAETRAGRLTGEPRDLALVNELEARVRTDERFFAFPYIPLAYFLVRAENPTRYSFLQPGMMSDLDEESALLDLQDRPPSKVLYMDVRPEAYLRLFPSSDPERLRMHRMEEWLSENYTPMEEFSLAHPGYHLLVRR